MPFKVSAFPDGLQALLGTNLPPETYSFHPEAFMPVLDLEPYLFASTRAVQTEAFNAVAPGFLAVITVPPGELWALFLAVFNVPVVDADQAINFNGVSTFTGSRFFGPVQNVAASTRGVGSLSPMLQTPLIVRGGDLFEFNVNAITVGSAGSIVVTTRVLYSRIR